MRWTSPCRLWSSNRDWASHLHWPLPQVLRILYFKNVEIVFFVFSLHFRFCPWLSNGSLTNQITITNLFQAVRNLPRRRRLRSVLEVPGWKTQQVQLPTRTRLWLGTSNTFLFKTDYLMSSLFHCLISHWLLLCCLWLSISICLAYDLYSLFSFNRPTLPSTYNLHVTCLHCSIVLTPSHAQVSRGCRWADQVPECSTNSVVVGDYLKDHTNYSLVTKILLSCDQ